MKHWLNALRQLTEPGIVVTMASVVGSGPRETGAKMLVTANAAFDTIGGGHLEMRALEIAREMLLLPAGKLTAERRLQRFPLGPALGQCCGGVVQLVFERIDLTACGMQHYLDCLHTRFYQGADSWRLVSLDQLTAPSLRDAEGVSLLATEVPVPHQKADTCQLFLDEYGHQWMSDPCLAYRPHVMLFGAGHVGSAIVRLLAELPCIVTWVDERADQFPTPLPANVTLELTDTPQALIASAPADVMFLVLTHSHALDQLLVEHILRRAQLTWFGLIGSHTKRSLFERRLQERGINAEQLGNMVCPIGIDGIKGKSPAVLAVAVVAQLLQQWEAQDLA